MITPNKNAGFPRFFSCNFLSGVVISGRTIPPVLLARRRGGQSRGIFFSGEWAAASEAPSWSPQFFQSLCNDTEINPERGHKHQWQMQRR